MMYQHINIRTEIYIFVSQLSQTVLCYAKQKHPGCKIVQDQKEVVLPTYVRPKALLSVRPRSHLSKMF